MQMWDTLGSPFLFRLPARMMIGSARALIRLRLKLNWLTLPFDAILFERTEILFRRINSKLRFINLHD